MVAISKNDKIKDVNTKIRNLVLELKKDPNVLAVYLFGSYATGKQKPYSDVDICVLLEDSSNAITYYGFGSKLIDLSVFDRLPLSARYSVFKEGKPLFVRDEEKLNAILFATMRNYLDNKHLYNLQFEYVLNKDSVKL